MSAQKRGQPCAYCGGPSAETVDHVVPRSLYPPSKGQSRVQRVTVPACMPCNNGWSDDEVHFRNMLLLSGDITPVARELWEGKTRRSFHHVDGKKRAWDLVEQFVPVEVAGQDRHMIYPGHDPRVTRIIRKVIRGLSHHFGLLTPVSDQQVWVDVQKYLIPSEFEAGFTVGHLEKDVLEYRYCLLSEEHLHSAWILRFFGRTPFMGIVYRSEASRKQFEKLAEAS